MSVRAAVIVFLLLCFISASTIIPHFINNVKSIKSTPTFKSFVSITGSALPVGYYLISKNRDTFTFIGTLMDIRSDTKNSELTIKMTSKAGINNTKIFTINYPPTEHFLLLMKQHVPNIFPPVKNITQVMVNPQNISNAMSRYKNMPILVIAPLSNDEPFVYGSKYTCNQIILAELQQNKFIQDNCAGNIRPQIYVYEKN